jgi:hypothetical protein
MAVLLSGSETAALAAMKEMKLLFTAIYTARRLNSGKRLQIIGTRRLIIISAAITRSLK